MGSVEAQELGSLGLISACLLQRGMQQRLLIFPNQFIVIAHRSQKKGFSLI